MTPLCGFGCLGADPGAPPLADDLGLEVGEYSAEELYEATEYYWELAAQAAERVERDPQTYALVRQPFERQAQVAGASYEPLARDYAVFAGGSAARVKELWLLGDALLYVGSDGIFIPVTGEANVPANCAVATQEFNMCHEAAHRLGIAAEEEANFAAFLACTANDAGQAVNDAYLKVFGEEAGVRSYGLWVDYLIAWRVS